MSDERDKNALVKREAEKKLADAEKRDKLIAKREAEKKLADAKKRDKLMAERIKHKSSPPTTKFKIGDKVLLTSTKHTDSLIGLITSINTEVTPIVYYVQYENSDGERDDLWAEDQIELASNSTKGGYYEKYLKYKQKYLELKNSLNSITY